MASVCPEPESFRRVKGRRYADAAENLLRRPSIRARHGDWNFSVSQRQHMAETGDRPGEFCTIRGGKPARFLVCLLSRPAVY